MRRIIMRGITDAIVFEVVKDVRTKWIGVLMSSLVAGAPIVIFRLPRGHRRLRCQCLQRSSLDTIPARRALKTATGRRWRPVNKGVEVGSEKQTRELVLLREQLMGNRSLQVEIPPG